MHIVLIHTMLLLIIAEWVEKSYIDLIKNVSLVVRGKYKFILYAFSRSLKRNWIIYITIMVLGIIGVSIDNRYSLILIILLFNTVIYPYVYIVNKNLFIIYLYLILTYVFFLLTNKIMIFSYLIVNIFINLLLVKSLKSNKIVSKKKYNVANSIYFKLTLLSCFIIFIIYSLVVKNDIIMKLPIEQIMVIGLLGSLMAIENKYINDKRRLITLRKRGFINVIKKNKINNKFISDKQSRLLVEYCIYIGFMILILAAINQMIIDYIILFFACIMIVLFYIDIFLQHNIFQISIVYQNKIINKLINGILHAMVFQQMMFYTVVRIIKNKFSDFSNLNYELLINLFRYVNCLIFVFLIIFFYLRYKKSFTNIGSPKHLKN